MRGQRTDDRSIKALNIEQQNKKPQNDEVITSMFEIPCSIFCGSEPAVEIPNFKHQITNKFQYLMTKISLEFTRTLVCQLGKDG
jgi:hypothetical protein